MSEKDAKKYLEFRSSIDKSVSPYITLKIPIPKGVDREEFLRLEEDPEFAAALVEYVKKWLEAKRSEEGD
jgi:hypothetical protein